MTHSIIEKIDEFIDSKDWAILVAGYTFDHIVLGDNNLSNRDIQYCLSNEIILNWLKQKIADYENGESDDPLHWAILLREAGKISAFLHELWLIPEEEREAAEESYHG